MYDVDSIYMRDEEGNMQALSNRFANIILLEDSVAECKSSNELLSTVNKLTKYKHAKLFTDNKRLTRLIFNDATTDYLEVYKIPDENPEILSAFSDTDLVMEMLSRGYAVSKPKKQASNEKGFRIRYD